MFISIWFVLREFLVSRWNFPGMSFPGSSVFPGLFNIPTWWGIDANRYDPHDWTCSTVVVCFVRFVSKNAMRRRPLFLWRDRLSLVLVLYELVFRRCHDVRSELPELVSLKRFIVGQKRGFYVLLVIVHIARDCSMISPLLSSAFMVPARHLYSRPQFRNYAGEIWFICLSVLSKEGLS